jgi:multimeric flavodoxin WrbA
VEALKMKIVAVCGSPHKGSCYSVLSTIADNHPEVEYKLLMLGELNFEPCKGCYACIALGEDKCPLKDDRDRVVNEMLDADGVIFASPVYVNHISGLMKCFIDRIGYESHRPRFLGKQAMVMAVCGGFGADEAVGYLEGIVTTFGFSVVSKLELQASTKSARETALNRQKAASAFDALVAGIESGQRNPPELQQVIMFHMFKAISEAYPDRFPADRRYYQDKTGYYDDSRVSFWKQIIARRVVKDFGNEVDATG